MGTYSDEQIVEWAVQTCFTGLCGTPPPIATSPTADIPHLEAGKRSS
jgi:hypothetical protein